MAYRDNFLFLLAGSLTKTPGLIMETREANRRAPLGEIEEYRKQLGELVSGDAELTALLDMERNFTLLKHFEKKAPKPIDQAWDLKSSRLLVIAHGLTNSTEFIQQDSGDKADANYIDAPTP